MMESEFSAAELATIARRLGPPLAYRSVAVDEDLVSPYVTEREPVRSEWDDGDPAGLDTERQ